MYRKYIFMKIKINYLNLKTQIPKGGNAIWTEYSLKFQDWFSILIGFSLVIPLPPYAKLSKLKISIKFPFCDKPIL